MCMRVLNRLQKIEWFFFVSKQYSMKAGHTCVKKERKRKKQTTNER